MKLNRKELRIIQYDFNSYSNRLLQADYDDYADVLRKFVNYIDNIPIIIAVAAIGIWKMKLKKYKAPTEG